MLFNFFIQPNLLLPYALYSIYIFLSPCFTRIELVGYIRMLIDKPNVDNMRISLESLLKRHIVIKEQANLHLFKFSHTIYIQYTCRLDECCYNFQILFINRIYKVQNIHSLSKANLL